LQVVPATARVERRLIPAREAVVVPLIGGMTRLVLAGFVRS
jgi:hypothetical protein